MYCMKLILQPIVENTMLHAFRDAGRKGEMDISAKFENNNILFEITDDGIGMDEDTLNNLSNNNLTQGKGFGIYNVNKRVKLLYGETFGLKIYSKKGKGTKVTLLIPIKRV